MNIKFRGFTLIELMVVIAIIGIVSTIVLASLSLSKSKGADAAIQQNFSTIQQQAEAYYVQNRNSYGTPYAIGTQVCPTSGTTMFFADKTILAAINSIASISGTSVNCGVSATSWVVWGSLKYGVNGMMYWCADSLGKAKPEALSFNAAGNPTSCI